MSESGAIRKYLNPRTGYWGKTKMSHKFGKKNYNVLRNMVSLQRHREINNKMKRKLYRHETAPESFYSVQCDLAFLPKLRSPKNRNVWGFLVVIDVFSRYLWVKTFTNRRDLHVPLETVIKQMNREFGETPKNMTGDNEFATTRLQQLAARYNFKWWYGDAHEKFRTGIAERVIRTIKNLIKRYVVQNNTTKYVDALSDLVYNYNNTIHRTIGTTPYKAITTGRVNMNYEKKKIKDIEIGQTVRVLEPRTIMTKGDTPYYSKDVFEVVGRDRNRYVLKNVNTGNEINKRYGKHQLLIVGKKIIDNSYIEQPQNVVDVDDEIAENASKNRLSRQLNRMGIEMRQLDDPIDKQVAQINQGQFDDANVEDVEDVIENEPQPRRSARLRERELEPQPPAQSPSPESSPEPLEKSEADKIRDEIKKQERLKDKWQSQGKVRLVVKKEKLIADLKDRLKKLQVSGLKKFGRNINIREDNNLSDLIRNMDEDMVLPQLRGFGRNVNVNNNNDLSSLISELQNDSDSSVEVNLKPSRAQLRRRHQMRRLNRKRKK